MRWSCHVLLGAHCGLRLRDLPWKYPCKGICLASVKAKWSCSNSINIPWQFVRQKNAWNGELSHSIDLFLWHTVRNQLPILDNVFEWLGFPAALVQRWTWNSLSCTTAQSLIEQYKIAWDNMYSIETSAILQGNEHEPTSYSYDLAKPICRSWTHFLLLEQLILWQTRKYYLYTI